MIDCKNRIGRFALNVSFLEKFSEKKRGAIFSKVNIYKAELFHHRSMIYYEGTSKFFKTSEKHEEPPWYRVIFQGEEIVFVESKSPIYYHCIPIGYGEGVIQIPFGYKLVSLLDEDIVKGL